ncbi:hypothetical protein ACFLWR_03355 [Chloroflexota bacterium]
MRLNRKKEAGFAYLLVLIILAIGALTVVPALRLSFTSLQSTEILNRVNQGFYAAESAQNFVQWDLYYGDLMQELGFLEGESSANFSIDICGTPVDVSVIMRATELEGGVTLAGEDTILPTKTITPSVATSKNDNGPFTYTIAVKQISSNTTNGLDVIYDIMSPLFKGKAEDLYVKYSSKISTDNETWQDIDDPKTDYNSNALLRWPASGSFPSPFRDFYTTQTKYLQFQMNGPFNDDGIVCNWVVIQVGDVFTLSGPQAPLAVQPTSETECSDDSGVFSATKTSDPTVIPPNESTNVTYTVKITNTDIQTNRITQIDDYLPPGFEYIGPTTGDITDMEPYAEYDLYNGVYRWHLWWQAGLEPDDQLTANGISIAGGVSANLTFRALATQGISGQYYNEVVLTPANFPSPGAFNNIDGFSPELYATTYSWNTGVVIVPAYDANTLADGANITSNLSVDPNTVSVISWTVE